MPSPIIPVHILYHDGWHEQPIRSQAIEWAEGLRNSDPTHSIHVRMIRMGSLLDAPSTLVALVGPEKTGKQGKPVKPGKLNYGLGSSNFRVDFRRAFELVLADYVQLANQGPLFEPEIVFLLSALPMEPGLDLWQKILDQQANPVFHWINQSALEPGQREDIDKILSKYALPGKTLKLSLIMSPTLKELEAAVHTDFDLLKGRLITKLSKLKSPRLMNKGVAIGPQAGGAAAQPSAAKAATPAQPAPVQKFKPIFNKPPVQPAAGGEGNVNPPTDQTTPAPANPAAENPPSAAQPPAQPAAPEAALTGTPEAPQAMPAGSAGAQPAVAPPPPPAPKVIAPAEWQKKDPPPEMGDRKPHWVRAARPGPANWYLMGASQRGKMHENDGTFREDAFAMDVVDGWMLVAVADGAGSHHLSRVGSNLAVETAVKEMGRIIAFEQSNQDKALKALPSAMQKAWEALSEEAKKRPCEFRDLSTTLLLLMYHQVENLVGVAQVGDGLIAAQLEDGEIALLGTPESGEYSGQTYFLTNYKYEDLASKTKTMAATAPIKLFFVMTDGVADDLYPPQERLPGLIKPLPGILSAPDPKAALLTLINYNRAGSFDDRTLVVVCQPEKIIGRALPAAEPEFEAAVETLPPPPPPAEASQPASLPAQAAPSQAPEPAPAADETIRVAPAAAKPVSQPTIIDMPAADGQSDKNNQGYDPDKTLVR